MIDDRKILAIELLADGELPKTEIAKRIGVSRQALYDWLNDDEFKIELDNRLQGRKVLVQKIIDSKLEFVIDKLFDLATNTKNARVQAQVLQYLADRALGKPSSTMSIIAETKNDKKISQDVLENEFDEWESQMDSDNESE